MSDEPSELPELSPAQVEIMEIVWERVEVSAREVRDALAPTRPVSRNTVRTLLERMEQKGWLRHRVEGRTFLYSAACPRQESIRHKVRQIVETLCGGSPATLVAALLDDEGLDDAEIQRIRKLLNRARTNRTKRGDA